MGQMRQSLQVGVHTGFPSEPQFWMMLFADSGCDTTFISYILFGFTHAPTVKGVTRRRVLGILCLRRTGWYPTERDIEYLIGL